MEKKDKGLSDHLNTLFKWKKFLLINFLLIIIIVSVLAFLMPNQYKATASVIIPPETMSVSGIGSLLGGGKSSASSVGSKLLGISNTSEDILLGILNSRTALTKTVERFNLKDYYEVEDGNIDKILKAFKGDLSFETNEYGIIEIGVTTKKPNLSAEISNYLANLVDSMNITLNTQAARNNRTFIEKRYLQNVEDLKVLEDSMYRYQKKYGIFSPTEQFGAAIKSSADLEVQLVQKQLMADMYKTQFGEGPQLELVNDQVKFLQNRISELKNSNKLSNESNVLFPFKAIPQATMEYFRLYRSLEIQGKLMEFILPMYEQSKVDEQKSIPTVLMIDKAVPPQVKSGPKRSLIILGFSAVGFFFLVLVLFRAEEAVSRKEFRNDFEEKESTKFNKIASFYRIR